MVILGLVVASGLIFLIGLLVGAGTNSDPNGLGATSAQVAPDRDDGPFPPLVAAVTVKGDLVAIRTSDGARRTLVTPESMSGAPTELGFGGIAMPDSGRIVYYERRSETGSTVWRVGAEGGPAQRVTDGTDPAISPNGRLLATIVDASLVITDLARDTFFAVPAPANTTLHLPAWAPTSRALVLEARTGTDVRLVTATLGAGDSSRDAAEAGPVELSLGTFTPLPAPPSPDGIEILRRPTWRASDNAIVGLGFRGGAPYGVVIDPEQGTRTPFAIEGPALEADYDSMGLYFGYVLEQGVARWQGRGNAGRIGDDIIKFAW